jgi:imidazolonepropionase-like amidohydrolase
MRHAARRRWSAVVVVLAVAATWLSGQAPARPVQMFVGASVVQGDRIVDNAVIIVRDGRVDSVAPKPNASTGVTVVNLAGKFVVPGLISVHSHVSDIDGLRPRAYTDANTARQLGVFARYGLTTVWSLGGEQAPAFAARDAQQTPALNRARLYVAGPVVTGTTPDAAREAVARVAALKADIVKIRVDDNLGTSTKMAPEVYRAVIDESHRLGLRVAAHIYYLADAKDLLRAGVDMIAHSVRDRDIDDEFIQLMKARNIPYCPTLTRELATFVYETTPAFFADPFFLREADPALVAQLREPARQDAMRKSASAQAYKAALVVAKRNLKRAADAGVLIGMGTDSGAFPERFEGYFEHLEMELMAEAGLTPAQILRSATVDAARALQVKDIGTLTPGSWADFVVLDRDPTTDIRHTRAIASVWIAGNRVPAR